MPTPSFSRTYRRLPPKSPRDEWRCTSCNRLLGIHRDGGLQIKFARGYEYLVALPATCTCRGCGTLNRTSDRTT